MKYSTFNLDLFQLLNRLASVELVLVPDAGLLYCEQMRAIIEVCRRASVKEVKFGMPEMRLSPPGIKVSFE